MNLQSFTIQKGLYKQKAPQKWGLKY